MAELLGVKIKIGGMWHAGSYDPRLFRKIDWRCSWVRLAEESMSNVFDLTFLQQISLIYFYNLFAAVDTNKIFRVGWSMEYMNNLLFDPGSEANKHDMIIFPPDLPQKSKLIFLKIYPEHERH